MDCKKSALWDTVKWVKWGLKVANFITLAVIFYNFCLTCLLKRAASTLISALVGCFNNILMSTFFLLNFHLKQIHPQKKMYLLTDDLNQIPQVKKRRDIHLCLSGSLVFALWDCRL